VIKAHLFIKFESQIKRMMRTRALHDDVFPSERARETLSITFAHFVFTAYLRFKV